MTPGFSHPSLWECLSKPKGIDLILWLVVKIINQSDLLGPKTDCNNWMTL